MELPMSTTKSKFMCLFRFPTDAPQKQSSPEEMQAQYAAWTAWMAKFKGELIPGGPLKPTGAVTRGGNVTDGPYIEAKEVIASYATIEADSLARAIEIIKDCPIGAHPEYSVEIREMGYGKP
jgi:hypothetical protein